MDYIVMIGAVLAIFLGYNAFHAERESGTLRILLTHPVTQRDVVTGKLTGAAGMISAMLAATFLMNLLLFMATTKLAPTAEEEARGRLRTCSHRTPIRWICGSPKNPSNTGS